jgi:hypothetical protein
VRSEYRDTFAGDIALRLRAATAACRTLAQHHRTAVRNGDSLYMLDEQQQRLAQRWLGAVSLQLHPASVRASVSSQRSIKKLYQGVIRRTHAHPHACSPTT